MKTQNLKIGTIFGVVLVGILLISGCIGGGNGDQKPTGTETPPTEQPPEDKKTPAKEQAEQEEPETEERESENPGKSLADMLNLGKPQGYTISYDMTGKEMSGTSKMTMYFAGEKKIRMDSSIDNAEVTTEGSVFIIGKDMYSCAKTDGEWVCFSFNGEDIPESEETSGVFEANPEKPLYDGTQNIAGVSAECYKLESEGTEYKYCVHPKKYLMLLSEVYINGNLEYRMIATNVDLNMPSSGVFELPAEPMDMSEMMGRGDPCAMCNMLSGEDKAECLENC